jgi:hypothetical protein
MCLASYPLLGSSSRLIQTSILYPLRSIGQIATLTLHIYLVVLASSLADRSHCIQPVFLSGNRFPNDRPASGHPTLTRDITGFLNVQNGLVSSKCPRKDDFDRKGTNFVHIRLFSRRSMGRWGCLQILHHNLMLE